MQIGFCLKCSEEVLLMAQLTFDADSKGGRGFMQNS